MTGDFLEPPDDDQLPDDVQAEIDAALETDRQLEQEIRFNEQVSSRIRDLKITAEARRRITQEERANFERPKLIRLDHLLATHFDRPTYRIDDLWPSGGRILLTAQWKAGKSVMVGNIIRALVDGDKFLDTFLPTPARHVLLIDNELDPARLQLWFRDQGITNTDRVTLLSLRGRVAAFDITDPQARAEWVAEILTACRPEVVILDCLRPILDALGLDENHEAGRFLVPFDAFLHELDATEGGIVHHMGHGPERSRGDSRLLDWPDAVWKIVRDKDDEHDTDLDDPAGARYFSAYGRDVDQGQVELLFHKPSRRLSLGTKSRTQATEHRKLMQADQAVMAAVSRDPGLTKRALRQATRLHGLTHNPHIDEAVERLVETGLIVRVVKGQTHLHYPSENDQIPTTVPTMPHRAPTVPNTVGGEVCPVPLKGAWDTPPHPLQIDEPVPATKTCPDCEHNTIPQHHARCPECADRLHREAMPDD